MNKAKVEQKAEAGEGLTVAEIKVYQKTVKPEKQVYGSTERLRNSISKIKESTGRLQIFPNICTA